ncbi:MAG: hypothetical protein MK116_03130 [Phycisphaerales bacterium]|nr:hypothetical protein [Phycisphaerales bacterium]
MLTFLSRLVLVAIFAIAGAVGPSALAAEKPAIWVYSAGVDNLLADDLDSGLHKALVSLERHGLSLPTDGVEAQGIAVNLLYQALVSRMSFQWNPSAPDGSERFPGSIQLSVHGNSGASVSDIAARLRALFQTKGAPPLLPVAGKPKVMLMGSLGKSDPPVYLGQTQVGGEDAVVMSINAEPGDAAPDLSVLGLPAGATPMLGLGVNLDSISAALTPMVATMGNSEQAQIGFKIFTKLGFWGPDAMDITIGCGSDSTTGFLAGRVTNVKKHYGEFLPDGGLGDAQLRMIPNDATAFDLHHVKLSAVPNFIDGLLAGAMPPGQMPPGPDGKPMSPVDAGNMMAQQVLGINLKTEFFDYLGDTVAVYRSNSSGGGGLFSLTALVGLSDAAGMKKSLATLASNINMQIARQVEGYVRLVDWSAGDDVQVLTLAFPGLPVPVQLSFGVADDQLIIGMTPETVKIGASQLKSTSSILSNPNFLAVHERGVGNVQRLQYLDTGARLSMGYGLTAGLMTAIGNYAIPRNTVIDGIETIMPAFDRLESAARPTLVTTRVDGDDLVMAGTGSRSVVLHVTAMVGELMTSPMILGAMMGSMVGVMMPALDQARSQAEHVKAQADVRQIQRATQVWASQHDGDMPQSLQELVDQHFLAPMPDMGMIEYHGAGKNVMKSPHPGTDVLAAMRSGSQVAVVFMNGRTQMMSDIEYQLNLEHGGHDHDHGGHGHDHGDHDHGDHDHGNHDHDH